jgi:hypothetical protein
MSKTKKENRTNKLTNKPNKMATTQITFTPEQITHLRDWFNTQSRQYVNTVMDDDFEGDEENFQKLCDTTFNTDGFKVGKVKSDDKSVKEKTSKRTRKAKDPDAPKRPKSAYMCWLWSDDGVAKVKSENDGMAHKDAVKRASEVWASMSADDKVPWDQKSAESKKEYEDKMKLYTPTSASESDGETDELDMEVPDGWEMKRGMYLGGWSSAGKTKYTTMDDAINAMDGVDDAGGIVYDGKHFTVRKNGNPRVSKKTESLFLKL